MRATWVGLIVLAAIFLTACGVDEPPRRLAFEDISSELPSRERYGGYGALWGDFNNDERVDLIFIGHGGQVSHGTGPLMLATTQNYEFKDVTDKSGLKDSDWEYKQQADRHGASCADFDNDGNMDLYITHGAMRGKTLGIKYDELLKGNGDFTFEEISRAAGTMNQFGRARKSVWFDFNRDGWIDLFVANFESDSVMYRNNGDGTFTDVTAEAGLVVSAVSAAPADFDQDGDLDLLVTPPLKLYRNDGRGRFELLELPNFAPTGLFALGIAWGDPDNDGDLDIFASSLKKGNKLFINEGERFSVYDSDAWKTDGKNSSTGVSWGDMDNDGLIDVVNVRSDGYFIYVNEGDLSFSAVDLNAPPPADPIKSKNGDAALADFNRDGLLDIATDDMNGYRVLQNRSAPVNNWLELKFLGTSNNRLGLGNKVWVSSKGKLIAYREYTGSGGNYRSASCGPLHIGVGQHSEVDLRVKWLDGFESMLRDVPVNQRVAITDSTPAGELNRSH